MIQPESTVIRDYNSGTVFNSDTNVCEEYVARSGEHIVIDVDLGSNFVIYGIELMEEIEGTSISSDPVQTFHVSGWFWLCYTVEPLV